MRIRTFIAALFASTLVFSASGLAFAGPEKVSPLLRAYTHPEQGPLGIRILNQVEGVTAAAAGDGGVRVLIQGDVERHSLEALGVKVGTQAGNVFTATIPPEAILAVSDLPGMIRIEAARQLKPNNNVATGEVNVEPELWGSSAPPYPGQTGAGVLVGSVDSGYDYSHPDFRNAPNDSRFDSIWDQTVAGTPPAGYGYGHLWDAASLDNNTSTTNDPAGHGTHVMGSLAGNGSGTGGGQPAYVYTGVAPEAAMVGVKGLLTDASIIDGVDYIFSRATTLGLPCVVNLSLGGQFGPHDGTDPLEVALDALTGPGRIIVASAGNEGDASIHVRGTMPSNGQPNSLDFLYAVGSYTPAGGADNDAIAFDGYYASTDDYDVTLTSPNGIVVGPVSRGASAFNASTDGRIYVENGLATTATGDYEVYFEVYDQLASRPPASGTWTVTLDRGTSTGANIDIWNWYNSMPGLFYTGVTSDVTLGSPGTANEVITVAAYTTTTSWNATDGGSYTWADCPCTFGEIAGFSSRGPTRTGGMKPDIAAPGFGVFSTLSDDVPLIPGVTLPLIATDDNHWIQTGTSMSSPLTAGVVALILEENPTFTPADVKTRLTDHARTDGHTGAVWNKTWGNGKLNGKSADAIPPVVAVTAPNGGEGFAAGTVTNITWSATDNFAVDTIDIEYSTDGGSSWMPVATGETNDGSYSWIVPDTPSFTAMVQVTANDDLANVAVDVSDDTFYISNSTGIAQNLIPAKLTLGPARPNPVPAGAGAEIVFGLTQDGPARLQVFDTAGRMVSEVPEKIYPAGFHSFAWDIRTSEGSRAASGMYFYRLDTEEGTISRKLMVLR